MGKNAIADTPKSQGGKMPTPPKLNLTTPERGGAGLNRKACWVGGGRTPPPTTRGVGRPPPTTKWGCGIPVQPWDRGGGGVSWSAWAQPPSQEARGVGACLVVGQKCCCTILGENALALGHDHQQFTTLKGPQKLRRGENGLGECWRLVWHRTARIRKSKA